VISASAEAAGSKRVKHSAELGAVRGSYINTFQRIGILLELRVHFQDHVVLIQLREWWTPGAGRTRRRAYCQCRGKNTKPASGVAVDRERGNQALI